MKFLAIVLLALPLSAQSSMTGEERAKWFAHSTFGMRSLLISGPFSAGWRTYRNRPVEWGGSYEGFGKRYGMRLVNNSITNGVEGLAGAAWGENPRYQRLAKGGAGARFGNAVKRTFVTDYEDGKTRFAFARAMGITTGAFAQNRWMPDSMATNRAALNRVGGGYIGRMMGNIFREFGPDLKKIVKRK